MHAGSAPTVVVARHLPGRTLPEPLPQIEIRVAIAGPLSPQIDRDPALLIEPEAVVLGARN